MHGVVPKTPVFSALIPSSHPVPTQTHFPSYLFIHSFPLTLSKHQQQQPPLITPTAAKTTSKAEPTPPYGTPFYPPPFAFVQHFESTGPHHHPEAQSHFLPAMVYPPPPPSPSQTSPTKRKLADKHDHTYTAGDGDAAYRPPVQPWTTASRPTSSHAKSPPSGYWTPRHDSYPSAVSPPLTSIKRSPSNADEEEAGLALAGLGHGLSAAQMKARRDSLSKESVPKKAKKNPKAEKGEMRKSCSECRRLKAKCDRQFPCSNCESLLRLFPSGSQTDLYQVDAEAVRWSAQMAISAVCRARDLS